MAIETETQKAARRNRKADPTQEANGTPLLAAQEFVEGSAVRIKMGDDTRASLDLLSAYINRKEKKAAELGFTIARLIKFYASKDANFAEYLDTNLQSAMSALVKSPKNADKGNKVDTHHASATRAA